MAACAASELSLLSSAQFSQVVFHNLSDSYPTDSGLLCKYSILDGVEYSEGDRIGIFQVGWQSIDEAFFLQQAPKPTNAIIFKVEDLPKDDKMYQLCYITKHEMLAGASVPFFFRSPLENELIAVEDSDNDFVTVNSNFAVVQSINTELTVQNQKLKEDLERMKRELSEAKVKSAEAKQPTPEPEQPMVEPVAVQPLQDCQQKNAEPLTKEQEDVSEKQDLKELLDLEEDLHKMERQLLHKDAETKDPALEHERQERDAERLARETQFFLENQKVVENLERRITEEIEAVAEKVSHPVAKQLPSPRVTATSPVSENVCPINQDGYSYVTVLCSLGSHLYFGQASTHKKETLRLFFTLQEEGSTAPQLLTPHVNSICLAKKGDEWYRAAILSVVSAAARVQLVDFGDIIDIWLQDLRTISAKSKNAPVYCFKFKLADTTPERHLNKSPYDTLFVRPVRFCQEANAWIVVTKDDSLGIPTLPAGSQPTQMQSVEASVPCVKCPIDENSYTDEQHNVAQNNLEHERLQRDAELLTREKQINNKANLSSTWRHHVFHKAVERGTLKEHLFNLVIGNDGNSPDTSAEGVHPVPSSNLKKDITVIRLQKEIKGLQAYIAELEATAAKAQADENRPQPTLTNEQVDHIVHVLSDELAKVELENKELKTSVESLERQLSASCGKSEANEGSSVSSDASEDIVHVLSDELTRVESENKSLKETVEGLQKQMSTEDAPTSKPAVAKETDDTKCVSPDGSISLEWERKLLEKIDDVSGVSKSESSKVNNLKETKLSQFDDFPYECPHAKCSELHLDVFGSNSEDNCAGSARSVSRGNNGKSTCGIRLESEFECPKQTSETAETAENSSQSKMMRCESIPVGHRSLNEKALSEFIPRRTVTSQASPMQREADNLNISRESLENLSRVSINEIPEVFKHCAQDYLKNAPQISWRSRSLISGFPHAVTPLNVILGQPVVENTTFKMQMETQSDFRSFSVEFTNNHSRVVLQLKASVFPEYAFILNSLDENWGLEERHHFLLEPNSVYDMCFIVKRDCFEFQVYESLSPRNATIKYRHRMPPSEIRYIHINGDVIVNGASVVEAENACCLEMRERLHTAFAEYTSLAYRYAAAKANMKKMPKKSKNPKKELPPKCLKDLLDDARNGCLDKSYLPPRSLHK